MNINTYFKNDFKRISLEDTDSIKHLSAFIENPDKKEVKYKEPLKNIFLHNTEQEMYLILDCLDKDIGQIEELCVDWEIRVMAFINFSKSPKEGVNYLRYNITILLLIDESKTKDEEYAKIQYHLEQSTLICKKIFLVHKNGKLKEAEETLLPFHFDKIRRISTNEGQINNLKNELNKLLNLNQNLNDYLQEDNLQDINQEKCEDLLGWLIEYENN